MPRKLEVVYWPYACPLRLQKVIGCRVRVGPKMIWVSSVVRLASPRGARVGDGGLYGKNPFFPAANSSWAKVGAFGPFDGLVIRPIKLSSRVSVASLLTEPQLSGGDLDRG